MGVLVPNIVFGLAGSLDVDNSLTVDRLWLEGLQRLCPKAKVCAFRLSLDLEP